MDEEIIATSKEKKTINKVNLTGSVVHKYRPSQELLVLTVAVNNPGGIHDVDYPNVTFYGETAEIIDKSIEAKNDDYPRVNIEGTIQTSRKETTDGPRYYQNVVGHSISRAQTNMEAISGVRGLGSHKAKSQNTVCLMGPVTSIYPVPSKKGSTTPMCVVVTIRADARGRTSYPRATCFDAALKAKAMTLKNGDMVCLTGAMETNTRTEESGRRNHMESIILDEIEVLKEDQ